jgi:large conductance mechanosensitive channel
MLRGLRLTRAIFSPGVDVATGGGAMGLLKEFRDFALKGNVIDLAVGVIIGVAFGAIVTSLVNDVMMPPLGFVTGGLDFSDKKFVMRDAVVGPDGKVIKPETAIQYGKFINATITFLIQAIAIFLLVKMINSAKRKPAPAAPAAPTREETLLMEIRAAIRARGG